MADTVSMIQRVNARYPRRVIEARILDMGYIDDGSMDDAGCVELAYMSLDRSGLPDDALRALRMEGNRPCPYPIAGDDGTAKDCISKGHCGCDEQEQVEVSK